MQRAEAKLLEGKVLAGKIQEEIKQSIEQFLAKGSERPKLVSILVGKNLSAEWYVGRQEKLAANLGIDFQKIPPDQVPDQQALVKKIRELSCRLSAKSRGGSASGGTPPPQSGGGNRRGEIHGIFLAMPLPKGFDPDEALLALDARKDVEGIHPTSLGLLVLRRAKLIPPTAYAALKLIESTGIEPRGRKVTLVGQSAVVGRPLQLLLGERRATTIVCNTGTPVSEIRKAVSESDVVVACAGQPGIVKGAWIKEGAVVIDIGTTEVDGKWVGDVEFEEAKKRAGFITPVPGGVGPLTVTMLLQNLIHAYQWQKGQ